MREEAVELVRHIDRMLNMWAEMGSGKDRNKELWEPLHRKSDALAEALGLRES